MKGSCGRTLLVACVAVAGLASPTGLAAKQAALDTAGIARAIGRQGTSQGDVYRVAFPRTDLTVTLGGVTIKPGLALGGWIAFKKAGPGAIAHGDLVLLQDEINPVISKLQEGGVEITALHNHLIDESPHVMYLHVWGQGGEVDLARAIGEDVAQVLIRGGRREPGAGSCRFGAGIRAAGWRIVVGTARGG